MRYVENEWTNDTTLRPEQGEILSCLVYSMFTGHLSLSLFINHVWHNFSSYYYIVYNAIWHEWSADVYKHWVYCVTTIECSQFLITMFLSSIRYVFMTIILIQNISN